MKVVVFSEWERMLELVAGLCQRLKIDFAAQSAGPGAAQRRAELQRFQALPSCRVLLSNDAPAAGLALTEASVVVHCDLPLAPIRLEQRLARVWRRDQHRAVTVLYLVSEQTIEQRIHTSVGSRAEPGGPAKANPVERLEQLMPALLGPAAPSMTRRAAAREGPAPARPKGEFALRAPPSAPHDDRPRSFAAAAAEVLGEALVACEERFPAQGDRSIVLAVVDGDPALAKHRLRPLEERFFAPSAGAAAPEIRLEVLDRAAAELLRRLAESGVVVPSSRASRVLYPAPDDSHRPALTASEKDRAQRARDAHAKRLNVARVFLAEGMVEEAREALVSAVRDLGRALAAEHRVAEPETPSARSRLRSTPSGLPRMGGWRQSAHS